MLSPTDRDVLCGSRDRREHDDLDRSRASAWPTDQNASDGAGVTARTEVPLAGWRQG